MRIRVSLFIILAGILASCSGTRSSLTEKELRSSVNPMELYIDSDLANSQEFSTSVAKVYRGNGFTQSGAFISSDGLFVTNFPIALEYFATTTQSDLAWLTDGFLANELPTELILPGVSLMIEVEQRDISHEYNSKITDISSNAEIAQIKQSVTQEIVQTERSNTPELVVQINELFNGQRFILSKYKVINDVRLVFAPATGILSEDIANTNDLVSKVEDLPVVLRAYSDNQPFTPLSYFNLNTSQTDFENTNVIGFPERSFRLDPHHALKFYNESTNPNIIQAYSAFLSKEERISWKNSQYAHQSIANRVNIKQNLNYYQSVQNSFQDDSIFSRKKNFDDELLDAIQMDSLSNVKYGCLFHF
jgi:hypothetical protein